LVLLKIFYFFNLLLYNIMSSSSSSSSSSSNNDMDDDNIVHTYQRELKSIKDLGNLTDDASLAHFFAFVNEQSINENNNPNWFLAGINYLLGQMQRHDLRVDLNTLIVVIRLLVLASIRDLSLEDLTYYLNSFNVTVKNMIIRTNYQLPNETIQRLNSVTQAFQFGIDIQRGQLQQHEEELRQQQEQLNEQVSQIDMDIAAQNDTNISGNNTPELQQQLEAQIIKIQALEEHTQQQNTQLQHQQQTIAELREEIQRIQGTRSVNSSPFTSFAETYDDKHGQGTYANQAPNCLFWMRDCANEMKEIRRKGNINSNIRYMTLVLNFFQQCTETTVYCHMGIQRITNVNILFRRRNHDKSQDETTLFIEAIQTGQLTLVQSIFNILNLAPNTGVEINAPNGAGQTPLDIATTFGYEDIIAWLQSKGATTSNQAATKFEVKKVRTDNGNRSDLRQQLQPFAVSSSSDRSSSGRMCNLFGDCSGRGRQSAPVSSSSSSSEPTCDLFGDCFSNHGRGINNSSSSSSLPYWSSRNIDSIDDLRLQLQPNAASRPVAASSSSQDNISNRISTKRSSPDDDGDDDGPGNGAQVVVDEEPDFTNMDSVARYLDFENFASINSQETLAGRTLLLLGNPGRKNQNNIIHCRNIIEIANGWQVDGGGKRRTMKVKKHFRKTKKRVYKKGKKTRMRRNNKSKRVLKKKR
jgi:hypothetical protein